MLSSPTKGADDAVALGAGGATPPFTAAASISESSLLLPTSPPERYIAASAAYTELRKLVTDAGLMDRRYDYYLLRGISSFVFMAAAVALLFVLPEGWGWTAFAALAVGFTSTQMGLLGHDAGHMAVFRRAWPNWLLGRFCLSFVLGVSFWFWRDRHNKHHVLTNDEDEDPDLELGGLFTLDEAEAASQRGWRRLLTRYQAFLFVPLVTLTLDLAFRSESWRHVVRELRGWRLVSEVMILCASMAMWASPFLWLGWRWLPIYIGVQWTANLYLGLAFAPNHKGMPIWATGQKLAFLDRQVLSSCNVKPGLIADYLYAGLNYQIEHHLFPTMPRVNFKRAQAIARPFCEARGLPFENLSVLGAYRQALGELHRIGQFTYATAQR